MKKVFIISQVIIQTIYNKKNDDTRDISIDYPIAFAETKDDAKRVMNQLTSSNKKCKYRIMKLKNIASLELEKV